jgi:hypothetical protein
MDSNFPFRDRDWRAQKDNAPGSTGDASDAISAIYGLRQVSALER